MFETGPEGLRAAAKGSAGVQGLAEHRASGNLPWGERWQVWQGCGRVPRVAAQGRRGVEGDPYGPEVGEELDQGQLDGGA
jgi:hypothetical protein